MLNAMIYHRAKLQDRGPARKYLRNTHTEAELRAFRRALVRPARLGICDLCRAIAA